MKEFALIQNVLICQVITVYSNIYFIHFFKKHENDKYCSLMYHKSTCPQFYQIHIIKVFILNGKDILYTTLHLPNL